MEALAQTTWAERGFLLGAREIYLEELGLVIQAAVARAFSGGDRHGG